MTPGSLVAPLDIQVHWQLELLAFFAGGLLYWRRRNAATQPPELLTRWGLLAGAALGAAIGSRLLYMLQYWSALQTQPPVAWIAGKTIVGGLLGALLGVETAKRWLGWRVSTGDGFVVPLILALLIGRLGCQLAGLHDLTYGNVTSLPWAWNYGDGLPRHPTALYEMFGIALLAVLVMNWRALNRSGDRFRCFLAGYLLLRLLIEFLKPPYGPSAPGLLAPLRVAGFSPIQWACVAGLLYYATDVKRWLTPQASVHG